ncbi:hypothetical protein QJS66_05525 [Kocuria rhizophila]|nr:hypothetical protein QJS66_05525 [Kocuria rhizophila]
MADPLRIFAAGGVHGGYRLLLVIVAPHRLDRITGWLSGELRGHGRVLAGRAGAQRPGHRRLVGEWAWASPGSRCDYVPEAHGTSIFSIIGEELRASGRRHHPGVLRRRGGGHGPDPDPHPQRVSCASPPRTSPRGSCGQHREHGRGHGAAAR